MILIGRKRISKALGLSWSTIRRYSKKFGLPILRTPGGRPCITEEIFEMWLLKLNRKGEK